MTYQATENASRHRRVRCRHGDECGACSGLGFEYGAQLARKQRLLTTALGRYRSLAKTAVLPCLPSPKIKRYRNRAKMAVGMSKFDPTKLGYFGSGTRNIVDAPECQVLEPELAETVVALRSLLRSGPRFPRELRHIDLRCGTEPRRQHLTLVIRSREMPKLPLDAVRKACRWVNGISVNLNPSGGPQVIRGPIEHQWGAREVFVEVAEMELRVSANSFFQVNFSMLEEIQDQMGSFLGRGDSLLDLYSGVGTHGLALARRFRRVTAIEGVRSSVADARSTIKRYGLRHVSVVPKPVERSLKAVAAAEADAVILNPSRAGAKEEVLDALALSPAKKLIYLSCEPKTLSRDLDRLVANGFRLVSVRPIDMMPQTHQVEAMALLRR
ncbi:MAG: 23S rRNA (uracil(1939)-C(5))-methyltransferase RlmD [Acidobacteriota bacterium]